MNAGGVSAIYHDKATWTSSSASHTTNSISADFANYCALPLTTRHEAEISEKLTIKCFLMF